MTNLSDLKKPDIKISVKQTFGINTEMEIDGCSVVPMMEGKSIEEKPAFMEIIANWLITKKATYVNLIGIRYKGFKYFRSKNDPSKNIGLYDLKADPLEVNNLASSKPEKIIEMEKILIEIQKNSVEKFDKNESQKNSTIHDQEYEIK